MKKAVLLVNLGSPDSTSVGDVRKYLREFLMDSRVLDMPWPMRFLVVNLAILPTRPKAAAHAYEKIWWPEGSPLVVISKRVREELQKRIGIPVELAMRYQNPSIPFAMQNMARQGITDLLLIPLFPQFAMASSETAILRVQEVAAKLAPGMRIAVQPPFYDHPDFIAALVARAQEFLARGYDHLLFSFHGIPERHVRKTDPTGAHCLAAGNCCDVPSAALPTCYRAQCFRTMRAFVAKAGLREGTYSISFQSRLGRDPWLKPYTDLELPRLAQEGKKKMLVMCPAFVSDCLETIEEIGMRGRDTFLEAGGTDFAQIPCLNEHPLWIAALENMSRDFMSA